MKIKLTWMEREREKCIQKGIDIIYSTDHFQSATSELGPQTSWHNHIFKAFWKAETVGAYPVLDSSKPFLR